MTHRTAILTVLTCLVLVTSAATAALHGTSDGAGDNGLVYMVHGHFEPAVTDEIPPPPAQEAFVTTQQNGAIVLYVIPYSVATETPVEVEDASITVEGPLPEQSLTVFPREGTPSDQRCVDETSLPGHEGDVSDCLVATFSAEAVQGWGAVYITLDGILHGKTVTETYSSVAHLAMHTRMEEGQPGFATADDLSAIDTPFLVEDLVDPVE